MCSIVSSFLLFVTAVCAILLRLVTTSGDPWLDEVCPIVAVRSSLSLSEVFVAIKLDGHASLATFFSYLIDSYNLTFPYQRLLGLLSSLCSLFLFWRLAAKLDRSSQPFFFLLIAISYPLVVISTEARGYGPMLMFALLGFEFLLYYCRKPAYPSLLAFWLSNTIAILFHPTALLTLIAEIAFLLHILKHKKYFQIASLFLFPSLILFLDYNWIKSLSPGGGIHRPFFDTVVDSISIALGGPLVSNYDYLQTISAGLFCFVAITLSVVGLRNLKKRQPALAAFLLVLTFLAPAILMMLSGATTIAVRYFLISIIGLTWLTGAALAAYWKAGKVARLIVVAFILTSISGSFTHYLEFAKYQRGQYEALFSAIEAGTLGSGRISTTSPQNAFRLNTLRAYLRPKSLEEFITGPAESSWLVDIVIEDHKQLPLFLSWHGKIFELYQIFRTADLSGFQTVLYREKS